MDKRVVLLVLAVVALSFADPDLLNPDPNLRTVTAGALIIPMDNSKQNLLSSTRFNLYSYGLVIKLLYANVPVQWIIRAGKSQNSLGTSGTYDPTKKLGIDMTAKARMAYPTPDTSCTTTCPSLEFAGGPFIVPAAYATAARVVMDTTLHRVTQKIAVYELMADTVMDIRYTITSKPYAGVLNSGGNYPIHANYFTMCGLDAGVHYEVMSFAQARGLDGNVCVTVATEPHFDSIDTQFKDSMYIFLNSGGNFLAQCHAIETYELAGGTMSDNGVLVTNYKSLDLTYEAADTPYGQFDGIINGNNGGSVINFRLLTRGFDTNLPSGVQQSRWINNAHSVVRLSNAPLTPASPAPAGIYKNPPDSYYATHGKLARDAIGGNLHFLGTHNWDCGSLACDNGVRMYMNVILTPTTRPPVCGFVIPGCPAVTCGTNMKPVDAKACACECDYDAIELKTCNWPASVTENCTCVFPDPGEPLPSKSPKTKGNKAPDEIASPPPIEVKDTKSNDALIGGVVGAVVGLAACLGLAAFLLARKNKKEKDEYEKALAEGELALGGCADNPLFKCVMSLASVMLMGGCICSLFREFAAQRQNPIFEHDCDINL